MKYLKLYENLWNYNYKIGDYLLIIHPSALAKISFSNDIYPTTLPCKTTFPTGEPLFGKFQIEYFDKNDKLEKWWITIDNVIRKLTDEEIEEFELKKSANKYNL